MTMLLKPKQPLVAFVLSLLTQVVFADSIPVSACSENGLAHRYVAAIEQKNLEQMAKHMAPDIHYQDPTMAFYGQGPIDLNGKAQTITFWRNAYKQSETQQLQYKILKCFTAGPEVVLNMTLSLKTAGAAWDINHKSVELILHHIMSLRLQENTIVQQIDYVDYQSMSEQIKHLQKQHGTVRQ